jgi:hypothetical protein
MDRLEFCLRPFLMGAYKIRDHEGPKRQNSCSTEPGGSDQAQIRKWVVSLPALSTDCSDKSFVFSKSAPPPEQSVFHCIAPRARRDAES